MDRLEGLKLGNYHILEQIGQGGMTSVFKAIDMVRNETVAVKILSPSIALDPKFETRFKREIELLLELKHTNIVPVLDYGKQNGFAYIVMPFMPRGTLYNRLQGGPLTPQEGVGIVSDISSGLQFAHEHGIVHRDVKPSNVLLSDDGRALLSDFGFAQVIDASLNLTGSALIGTPSYMSPEQCQGDTLSAKSDQYSMGVMLYQLCTGQLPFAGDTPMAIAVQHINEPLPRPRAINPRIPRDVERVLNKALSKRPSDRFGSVSELALAFKETVDASLNEAGNFIPQPDRFDISTWILERSPISGPIGMVTKVWRSRYRTAAVATVLLLLLPSAGFALAAFEPSAETGGVQANATSVDFQATIRVLSTQVSADSGSGLSPSQIAPIVQATMRAMAPLNSDQPVELVPPTGSPTATPTETIPAGSWFGSNPSPTQGENSAGGGDGGGNEGSGATATRTPSPTSSGGTTAPTSTPVPEPSNTPAPQPTNTSAPPPPTNTPAPPPPTNTSAPPLPTSTPVPPPQPTNTPKPVNTQACKPDGGGNPHCPDS
jgi:serine/threonine protein kinase